MKSNLKENVKKAKRQYDNIFNCTRQTYEMIQDMENCRNFIRTTLYDLKANKPIKFFNSQYAYWEKLCKELEQMMNRLDNILIEEYINLENTFHTN